MSIAGAQITMTVKSKSGPDKVYNIQDVASITFVQTIPGAIPMALVPAGSFDMGSIPSEVPVHRVTITRPFYISICEITQKLYRDVIGSNPSIFNGDDHPVEMVSWYDAVRFCNELSRKTGLEPAYIPVGPDYVCDASKSGFRLPTEAEWEYACRAGTVTDYYSGSTDAALDQAGWYIRNSDTLTHSVGGKIANTFGLFDMHGNVWEWCNDWYGPYNADNLTDPVGPVSGVYHVLRGGSFNYSAFNCRSAYRMSNFPGLQSKDVGFRVVRKK